MKAYRWPALVLIPALVALALVIGAPDAGQVPPAGPPIDDEPVDTGPVEPMPVAAPVDAPRSTWYCTGGTGTGSEQIERSVLMVTNTAPEERGGTLTVFSRDGFAGEQPVELGPNSRWQVDLAEVGEGDQLAVLLEVEGGGVAAALVVFGPDGFDVEPCASDPATSWHIPAGSTTLDAQAVLTLFNPFPDDAVFEIAFITPDEVRVPTGFEAFPIPAESVVAVDLSDIVTVREQFATVLEARTGQIVASMVQSYDGSEGVQGLSVLAGAPAPAETWFFPNGRSDQRAVETFVVFNPGERDAEVLLAVSLDDPEENDAVQPFELTVPRRGFVTVRSDGEEWRRVPESVGHGVSVRSQNGVPVVAAQLMAVSESDPRPGFASSLGSPLEAESWIVPIVGLADTVSSVAVLNPSPLGSARVVAGGVAEGERRELDPVDLAEGQRAVIHLGEDLGIGPGGGFVRADAPVVVSYAYARDDRGLAWLAAVPVAGSTEVPEPIEGVGGESDADVGGGD